MPREPAPPEAVSYAFTLSRRGERAAHVWPGAHVALLVELREDGTPGVTAPAGARAALLRALDAVYLAYVAVAGGRPARLEAPFRGRAVVQVPIDNAGAAGLAGHGVAGISVGCGLVAPLAARWTRACGRGVAWLPDGRGEGLAALRFGDARPEEAAIDQVFFYELARNFWPPWFNKKIDWACDGNPSCWGWWTVGMCNAMAVIIPALLNLPMNYFGQGRVGFRDRMVAELEAYVRYARTAERPFDAWSVSLMPWNRKESVNDLMTGLLVRSFECFGGESWISGFFREITTVRDINQTEAGGRDFQGARDNLYRIWSRAARANLYEVFVAELLWEISPSARAQVSAQFPGSNSLCLGMGL